jgi:hypothetical protein
MTVEEIVDSIDRLLIEDQEKLFELIPQTTDRTARG